LGLLRMKRYSRAMQALDSAVAINPNFERAHRVLAHLKWKLNLGLEAAQHQQMVRDIRARHLRGAVAKTGAAIGAAPLDGVEHLAAESDQEANQIGYDASPVVMADKSGVPKDPADCIIVVAGLPRTGTSMMMQMLAAAPLPVMSDGQRHSDSDNPKGYYELEQAARLHKDADWLAQGQGKVVKIIAQLLPRLPAEHAYRIIFMERDLDEVVRFRAVMLENLGREGAGLTDVELQNAYRQQLLGIKVWLAKQANILTLFIPHRRAMQQPAAVAVEVNAFLGGQGDEAAMAAVVDSSLYRQRAVA